ncbi:hypothetical protein GGR57DRAFT_217372 [Xylariaceae sp. FL1272]|nr:hypothetical protein GGR57DRAFT_217372 [Xylariaceae sp. FL1272]
MSIYFQPCGNKCCCCVTLVVIPTINALTRLILHKRARNHPLVVRRFGILGPTMCRADCPMLPRLSRGGEDEFRETFRNQHSLPKSYKPTHSTQTSTATAWYGYTVVSGDVSILKKQFDKVLVPRSWHGEGVCEPRHRRLIRLHLVFHALSVPKEAL